LKMGGYVPNANECGNVAWSSLNLCAGVIRFCQESWILSMLHSPLLLQRSLKRKIAYSSISHMGFGTDRFKLHFTDLGMACNVAKWSLMDYQLRAYSVLLSWVTATYDRTHTLILDEMGRSVSKCRKYLPNVHHLLSSLALPGMSGFVAE
jgi:NADH:ubiquinone oxidoreductase subunit 4 (subunit M)